MTYVLRRSLEERVSLACVGFNARNRVAFAYDVPDEGVPWSFSPEGREHIARALVQNTLGERAVAMSLYSRAVPLLDPAPKRGDALEVTRAQVLEAIRAH